MLVYKTNKLKISLPRLVSSSVKIRCASMRAQRQKRFSTDMIKFAHYGP